MLLLIKTCVVYHESGAGALCGNVDVVFHNSGFGSLCAMWYISVVYHKSRFGAGALCGTVDVVFHNSGFGSLCAIWYISVVYHDSSFGAGEPQGCINRGTCSHPELNQDQVLTSAYVIIFCTVATNAVNKSV